MDLGLVKLFF